MKIAVIGDPHLGCTTYTDKRIGDFTAKFNAAIDQALDGDVKAIFLLGDVFDSSAYRRSVESFATVIRQVAPSFMKVKHAGVQIFAIAGNHEYGRGRTGGELHILSDLGLIRFLDDEIHDFGDFRVAGISWKSDPTIFKEVLKKLGLPNDHDILLIHQFCEGSRFIPPFRIDVKKEDVSNWSAIFAGHHHHYEDLGYAIVPGSLEVNQANETTEKGFVIYDTEAQTHEFVPSPPSRLIRYLETSADGKTAAAFEAELKAWIGSNASSGAILVMKIDGALAAGRSLDINWNQLRAIAYQSGCLKIQLEGGLKDQVRTAPEIQAALNFPDFIAKKFGNRSAQALRYIDSLRKKGDRFFDELQAEILEEARRRSSQ